MIWVISLIGATIFIFGLINWAQSGATLWQIIKLKWHMRFRRLRPSEKLEAEDEIRRLEHSTDRYLLASLRIIGLLAIVTWVFLATTVILNAMGIDWIKQVSSQARVYWSGVSLNKLGNSQNVDPNNRVTMRNDILQGMGSNLK